MCTDFVPQEWNKYQPLPSQPQRPLDNGTSDVRHPPLSQTAVTLIRQVTDMGFPEDRVRRAVRWLGADDKKVGTDRYIQGFMQDNIVASHTCFGGHMDVNC